MRLSLTGDKKLPLKDKSSQSLKRHNVFRYSEAKPREPGGKLFSRTRWGMFPPDRYVLITLNSSLDPTINNFERLAQDWAILRKRIRREYKDFEFIWTYGISSQNMLHLHIVARTTKYILHQWLLNNWKKIHESYGVHIIKCNREAPEGSMNKYDSIAQYLRKNLLKVMGMLRKMRPRKKITARLWSMSDGWIKHRRWRPDMRALVINRGFDWLFSTKEGKTAWKNILLDEEQVETYLQQGKSHVGGIDSDEEE